MNMAMAKKKLNLTDLTTQELQEKLVDEKTHYRKLRFNHVVTALENPMNLRSTRRDIARIQTELKKRQNQTP
jgi:large subunit ribosomal protein L29